jgi:hypothetical protein
MSRKLKILAASLLIVVVSTVFLAGAAFAANQGSSANENKASGGQPALAGDCTCDCDCGDCDYLELRWQYGKK